MVDIIVKASQSSLSNVKIKPQPTVIPGALTDVKGYLVHHITDNSSVYFALKMAEKANERKQTKPLIML